LKRIRLTSLTALALLACAWTAPAGAQSFELSPRDVERLKIYHEHIAEAVARIPARASLADLVQPVMALAAARSDDRDAIDESRAAIVAIAFYVNGKPLSVLAPEARDWPRAASRRLMLRGRRDLAQHFTISAALAATAGAPVADLIGLYKEVDDARRGGGFSFVDLAADRAGTAFGRAATIDDASARRLQARVEPGFVEADMMPDIQGLPENLSEREFTRRYRGEGEPAYRALVDEIDRRVGALALFRANPRAARVRERSGAH